MLLLLKKSIFQKKLSMDWDDIKSEGYNNLSLMRRSILWIMVFPIQDLKL